MTSCTSNSMRLNRAVSAIALAMGLCAAPALAQTAPTSAEADDSSVPEIVVTNDQPTYVS